MARYVIFEATGTTADKLKTEHEQIAALDAPVMSLQQTYQGGGGPSDEELKAKPGMETFCAHLSDVRLATGVPDMDSATTLWQMNWVTATVAATDSMLNKDGNSGPRSTSPTSQGPFGHVYRNP